MYCRAGGTGGRGLLPAFQILANILTISEGTDYVLYIATRPPRIFRPSYGPTLHTTLPQQCSHMLMFPCFEMSGTLS